MSTEIVELRRSEQVEHLIELARANRGECAPHFRFYDDAIEAHAEGVLQDHERKHLNVWIAYRDGEPIGYSVGSTVPTFFNYDVVAKMNVWFVLPRYRGGVAAAMLIREFEDWARLNGASTIDVGVTRLDPDEAVKVAKLFPRLGYSWAGSTFVKETVT